MERPNLQFLATVTQGQADTSTDTDTQVLVRLNFSPRLTKATVEITLSSSNLCSGLHPSGARYTLTLTAPAAGPNYVCAALLIAPTAPIRLATRPR